MNIYIIISIVSISLDCLKLFDPATTRVYYMSVQHW